MTNETKEYTLTKRIAKHGRQAIIVIPKLLEQELAPGIIVQVQIKILKGGMN